MNAPTAMLSSLQSQLGCAPCTPRLVRPCQTSAQKPKGDIGQFRIGMGSGPGAMLMMPLLMLRATDHPRAHLEISRGSITLQGKVRTLMRDVLRDSSSGSA